MFSIIVAIGKNREIGKKNKLLWHIPEDLKNFKRITTDKTAQCLRAEPDDCVMVGDFVDRRAHV